MGYSPILLLIATTPYVKLSFFEASVLFWHLSYFLLMVLDHMEESQKNSLHILHAAECICGM